MHASLVACSYFYILKTLVFIVWIRVFGLSWRATYVPPGAQILKGGRLCIGRPPCTGSGEGAADMAANTCCTSGDGITFRNTVLGNVMPSPDVQQVFAAISAAP
ncbi:hypothetical protein BFJ66_g17258 [Fusarium oxysporum f. sp. cepae]|nr:hypothetical protein BFJ67_g17064 [Fusarium oxysporum f. sp. cepae]RKK24023.1 hypothetical protein BFJ66_g17258 [Fusarium oxysporum f. sp. cepae]